MGAKKIASKLNQHPFLRLPYHSEFHTAHGPNSTKSHLHFNVDIRPSNLKLEIPSPGTIFDVYNFKNKRRKDIYLFGDFLSHCCNIIYPFLSPIHLVFLPYFIAGNGNLFEKMMKLKM